MCTPQGRSPSLSGRRDHAPSCSPPASVSLCIVRDFSRWYPYPALLQVKIRSMASYFKPQSNVCLPRCLIGPEWLVLAPAGWWLCFLEKVARNFPDSERLIKWKVFYICEVTFHLLHVTFEGQRLTFWLGPCLGWISGSKSPAYRRIWDFFLPPPFLLFCSV